jgi:peptidoglycan/LPS O-acetylase OafA/YrhL
VTKDKRGRAAGQTDSALPQPNVPTRPDTASHAVPRQLWADVVRVAAVLMIFLYHFTPDWLSSTSDQPNHAEEFIIQHFAGWGIATFVVLSGFALALATSRSRASYGTYLSRRFTRILAPFWTVAIPLSIAGFALGEATWADIWKLPVWLLGLGLVHPTTYQPISEAWWYVSLALQISLVMPLLLRARRSWGLIPMTVLAIALNAGALAAVSLIRPEWEHLAQGLVFCRVAELAIGIAAADLVLRGRENHRALATALGCIGFTMAVSPLLDLLGMWTSWQAMLVLATLFAVCALFAASLKARARWLTWAAALSYCFYLTHAPVSKYFGHLLAKLGLHSTLVALPIVLIVCLLVAWLADWVARRWVTPPLTSFFRRLFVRDAGDRGWLGNTMGR